MKERLPVSSNAFETYSTKLTLFPVYKSKKRESTTYTAKKRKHTVQKAAKIRLSFFTSIKTYTKQETNNILMRNERRIALLLI